MKRTVLNIDYKFHVVQFSIPGCLLAYHLPYLPINFTKKFINISMNGKLANNQLDLYQTQLSNFVGERCLLNRAGLSYNQHVSSFHDFHQDSKKFVYFTTILENLS